MTSAKNKALTIFGLFFVANAALLGLALLVAFKQLAPPLLPEDTGLAVRLFGLLLGMALSWVMGRWIYETLIGGDMGVNESANAGWLILLALALLFFSLCFLNTITWIVQVVVLLALVVVAIAGLSAIFSALPTIAVVLVGIAAAAGIYFFGS